MDGTNQPVRIDQNGILLTGKMWSTSLLIRNQSTADSLFSVDSSGISFNAPVTGNGYIYNKSQVDSLLAALTPGGSSANIAYFISTLYQQTVGGNLYNIINASSSSGNGLRINYNFGGTNSPVCIFDINGLDAPIGMQSPSLRTSIIDDSM